MSSYLRSSIHTALLAAALAAPGAASAAEPQQTTFIEEIEVIVVTGSYIEGAAEDAALPIDVLRAEDLAKQGSPSMVELIKTIPAVQGVVGESNQYTAGATTGSSNINLRGLGGARTLVLMNGRRLAPATTGVIGYDTNLLPMAAIGRIEILKDGAAATYGSDAVAGVVNFITRSGFEGLSLEASYNYVEDTDGDYTANALYGFKGDSWDMLVAGGYRKRSALSTLDRDFISQNSADNPQGGFSAAANPGSIRYGNIASPLNSITDPGCAAGLGAPSPTGACVYQFTAFNNLVEEEEHYQAYTEINVQLGETTEFHVEALYAAHDVPEESASASYAPQQGATLGADGALSAPLFLVPKTNPGLSGIEPQLLSRLTPAQLAAYNSSPNVGVSGTSWRPFGSGGNPLTGGAKEDERFFQGIRLSTSVDGQLAGINWDIGVTYGENSSEINTQDILVSRLAAALQGFGGPNCTGTTAGAGGCLWLNPFSTAVARNPATGVMNPLFDPNTVNTAELANWLYASNGYEDKSTTLVGEVVLNGQLPVTLGSGDIGWATGVQYRKEGFERDPNDLTDSTLNPCVTSAGTFVVGGPIGAPGNGCLTALGTQSGVFSFFGPITPQDLDRNVKAVFGELNVPILENLSAQMAVRYETYGGNVGSTTNPKLSLRWQALEWFGLRGSVGTTFRGPLQTQLLSSPNTALAFVQAANAFRTFDNAGNPNLKPEEALTFNVGMIIKAGNFAGTADYWSYDFEDSLENESGTEIVARFFGTSATSPTRNQNCDVAAFAGLQSRFTFSGACGIENLIRTRTNVINGPDQKISGIDLGLSYLFQSVLGGDLLVGGDGTYTLEYERDAAIVEGILIQPAADYVGTRGASGIGAGTLPELRGSVYLDYSTNWLAPQGIRITSRYIDGVTDVRAGLGLTTQRGVEVGSFLTHDLVYRLSLPSQTTITASVINIADRDPPFARLELSYDPFIANPLGRYYKVLLNKKF